MIFFYNILNTLLLPFWALYLLYRVSKGKEQLHRLKERFGIASIQSPKNKKIIWIHVASVGEVLSIFSLINKLKIKLPSYQILLTSGTVTSAKLINDRLKNNVIHQFLPLDSYICVNLFLKHWKPNLAIFIDSEFWPCILTETAKKSKLISVNTRISPTSCQTWQKYPYIIKHILNSFSLFLPQSLDDEKRLKLLGAKNTVYIGNLKYCSNEQIIDNKMLNKLKALFKGRTLLLAASTHLGEEEIVAKIYQQLKKQDSHLLLILVPRHPIRGKKIKQILKDDFKLSIATRSENEQITKNTDIYLADTIGELNYFYSIAPISIIGGSFVPVGGHNLIEPARFGSVIIVGPHHFNFTEICKEFEENQAAFFVQDDKECLKIIKTLFDNQNLQKQYTDRAKKIILTKDQTLDKMLEKILPFTE
jgi:3-deoxy-D-manno-octulosonic-acid transferase